eukprot:365750-Chlamydomonas_euryale.AAC.3
MTRCRGQEHDTTLAEPPSKHHAWGGSLPLAHEHLPGPFGVHHRFCGDVLQDRRRSCKTFSSHLCGLCWLSAGLSPPSRARRATMAVSRQSAKAAAAAGSAVNSRTRRASRR